MTDAMTLSWVRAETWLWALIVGLALGVMFFRGLWWTVRKAVTSRRPALLFLGSFVLRAGLTLVGFYFAADGQWDRLVVCVVGFVLARFVVTRLTRPPEPLGGAAVEEGPHAPQSR